MQYLGRTWRVSLIAAAVLALEVLSSPLRADPSDGSQSVAMSENDVAVILDAKLDRSVPRSEVPRLARFLVRLCEKHEYDPVFILSLIQTESHFRTRAVSPMGAVGLMQLLPSTARVIARKIGYPFSHREALFQFETNIALGVGYLAYLRDKYEGMSPYYPIAAYNIGPARLDQLLKRPQGFKPKQTQVYYDRIRRGIPSLRALLESKKLTSNLAEIRVGT